MYLKLFAENHLNVQEQEMFGYLTVFICKELLCPHYKWCLWWICNYKGISSCLVKKIKQDSKYIQLLLTKRYRKKYWQIKYLVYSIRNSNCWFYCILLDKVGVLIHSFMNQNIFFNSRDKAGSRSSTKLFLKMLRGLSGQTDKQ